jgi:SAM-dependent methyltransferase
MTEVLFTGERLSPGSKLFGVDLARHRAAYIHATLTAHGDTLLDLGCGTGYGTAELAGALTPKIRVFGLDRVRPASTSRHDNARYLRADLNGIPLADASFDTITSFQVVEHLEDPTRYLEAIARLLRADGRAYITTPNILTSDKVNPWHVHEYEARELEATLRRHFAEVEMLGVGIGPAVADYFQQRLARIQKIMRLDPLGLRNLLPTSVIDWLFTKFSLVVRRGIQQDDGLPDATINDFPIGPADPADIDLLAVCGKPLVRE